MGPLSRRAGRPAPQRPAGWEQLAERALFYYLRKAPGKQSALRLPQSRVLLKHTRSRGCRRPAPHSGEGTGDLERGRPSRRPEPCSCGVSSGAGARPEQGRTRQGLVARATSTEHATSRGRGTSRVDGVCREPSLAPAPDAGAPASPLSCCPRGVRLPCRAGKGVRATGYVSVCRAAYLH